MIVLDTSALVAIILKEPQAEACTAVLDSQDRLLVFAATFAEALVVAARRGIAPQMHQLETALGCETVTVTLTTARRVGEA